MNDNEKYLYEGLNDSQREILMPPSAFGPHEATRHIWERAQAEQAELMRMRPQFDKQET